MKPDTPLDDLDIPKDIKFYVQQFLINEIQHRDLKKQLDRQLKKVQCDFKKRHVTDVTPEEFIAYQSEVQKLTTEFDAKCAYIGKTKERMSRQMDNLMKLREKQASVPPAALVPPAASVQHVDKTKDPSLCLKCRPEASPSTPPVAKKPTL